MEQVAEALLFVRAERTEHFDGGKGVSIGEDELVFGKLRIDLRCLCLSTLDRRDVVDPGSDFSGHIGLVVVVDELVHARLLG